MVEPSDDNGTQFVPPSDSEQAAQRQRGDRGKRWILPVAALGCGCVGIPILLAAVGVLGVGTTVRRLVRSTGTYQVYQLASSELKADATVQDRLGHPIETGLTTQSREVYDADGTGKVCLRFRVVGNERSGSAYAEAQSAAGAWQIHQLALTVNGEADAVAIVPLSDNADPLCPDFDALESPQFEDPDESDILPGTGTEI